MTVSLIRNYKNIFFKRMLLQCIQTYLLDGCGVLCCQFEEQKQCQTISPGRIHMSGNQQCFHLCT